MDNTYARAVYVVDGARTPFLKFKGRPGPFRASDLAVAAGRTLLARHPFDPSELDEVILGCIIPGPDEANIARIVAQRLGCGKAVPAWTVQRNCGSGMQALDCAALDIATGRAELVLAGGTEAMSHAPVLYNDAMVNFLADLARARSLGQKFKAIASLRPRHFVPIIGLLRGLTDPISGLGMGQTAEILAHRFGLTRARLDGFALESHQKLARAQDEGWMGEIIDLFDAQGRAYSADEGLRRDTDRAGLGKLKPAFEPPHGLVTAGNSAQVTDGAACLLLASADAVQRHHLPVLGRLVDCAWAGLEPAQMGLGPVHAAAPLLRRQGLETQDIDAWEINEAFASQVLACLEAWQDPAYCRQELGLEGPFGPIDPERLNVDGGAIALGHPVGCSGARIVLHVLNVLKRTGGHRGVAALCIGGGQGGAMLVERVEEVTHGH